MFGRGKRIALVAVVGLLLGLRGTASRSDNLYQGFETWPRPGSTGLRTNQSWVAYNFLIGGLPTYSTYDGTNAFYTRNGVTNSYLMSPWLTNGVGDLTYWCRTRVTPGTNIVSVQYTYDQTNWAIAATYELTNSDWTAMTNNFNIYTGVMVRIAKIAEIGGLNNLGLDAVVVTNPPARVVFADTATVPSQPLIGKSVDITTVITPSFFASNLAVTCFWRVASAPWTPIEMTQVSSNHYKTVTSIPAQSEPMNCYYCVTVWLQGNDALSPTNDPGDGTNNPNSFAFHPRGYETVYDSMNVIDDFPTNMLLFNDYLWQGVCSTTSALVNAHFRFSGVLTNLTTTNTFGDNDPYDIELPIPGTTELSGNSILVKGTNTGQFVFKFNESNLQFSARQCLYQDFSQWGTADYATETNNEWVVYDAYLWPDPLRPWRFRICELESNGTAAIRSPPLSDGIGEITFYYRNWDTTSSPTNTECYIQKSYTGSTNNSDWVTLATISDITTTNYGRYSLPLNDRYCRYIRILNSTNLPRNRLCLDEILLANAGAGVVFTNLVVTPPAPSATNLVTLSCDVMLKAGASNRVVTAYYRSGSSGPFTAINMTNTIGNTFVTVNPVPAGMGDLGSGVGTVQYYYSCSFEGYESEYASPIRYPEGGSNNATFYTVIPAQIAFSNVVTEPAVPVIGSNVTISADIIPVAGAQYITTWLYYRIGGVGTYAPILMGQSGPTNHYVSTFSIPSPSTPGTKVEYYFQSSFYGPQAMSPTNYPGAGSANPLTFFFRTPPLLSSYTNISVSGSFNTNLTQISDYEWQGLVPTNSVMSPQYRFNGFFPSGNKNWGETNQDSFMLPVFGLAETNAASDIVSTSVYGNVLFRFNESNLEYSVQHRCAYMNFDSWTAPDAGFGGYTNSNWVIADGRTTTNSPGDERAWRGRSCVMDSDTGPQYVRTPYLTNGVGEIDFWYRNWQTNGSPAASFSVQTSANGTNLWRTVTTVTNILTMDYLHFSYTLSDTNKHFVRILSGTNNPHASLCLDEIIVAEPGPNVTFTSVTNSPPWPTIDDEVTISAQISPTGGSTQVTAWVWYRAGTNGDYDCTEMTNSGFSFLSSPPIPKGPAGTIQYYLEAAFMGFRSDELVHVCYPSDGPFSPLSYTNSDMYLIQTFETWDRGVYTNVPNTNQTWTVYDTIVAGTSTWAVHAGTNAAFLLPWGTGALQSTNSWLSFPPSTNGVGFVSLWMMCTNLGVSYFEIQSATAETGDWTTIVANSCSSRTWTNVWYAINSYALAPLYLRIVKTGEDSGTPYFGLDDVSVSRPPAQVAISDVMIHPGYPASNESTCVSCTITSSCPLTEAMGITARVYYRAAGSGGFLGPIEMNKSGDFFMTSQGIPSFPEKTTVQYYIESTFRGYHRTDSESMSPTYSPAGNPSGGTNQFYSTPTTFFSYTVRSYVSDYNSMFVNVNEPGVSSAMEQYSDHTWQGVINFTSEAATPSFLIQGIGFYTGSNYSFTATNQWGDPNPGHSELPFASTMQPGSNAIVLPGVNVGQIVIRFNEEDLSYTTRRCAFQNFDTWQAPALYFDFSIDRVGIGSINQNFDTWPTSVNRTNGQSFNSWPVTNIYQDDWSPASDLWFVYNGLILSQSPGDRACQLAADPAPVGPPYHGGYVMPGEYLITDAGVGSFGFAYRCSETNNPPVFSYLTTNFNSAMYQATITPTDIPSNYSASCIGDWSASMFVRYVDKDNYYECKVYQYPANVVYRSVDIWRCKAGVSTRVGGPWNLTTSSPTEPWTMTLYLTSTTNAGATNVAFEVFRNSDRWGPLWDTSPLLTPGALGFCSQDADLRIDNVVAGGAQIQSFNNWTTSTNTSSIYGEWAASNVYMLSGVARLFTNPPGANVRSGILPQGVGSIRLGAYRPTSIVNPVLRIQKSSDGVSNWEDMTNFSITTTTEPTLTYNFNETNSVYVRFLNDTNAAGEGQIIYLDNIFIRPNTNSLSALTNAFDTASSTNGWTDVQKRWFWATNGTYNCRGYNSQPLTFQIQSAPLNFNEYGPICPADTDFTTVWSTKANCTNTHYETTNCVIQNANPQCIRVKHTGGYGLLVVDDFTLSDWRGVTLESNVWRTAEGWITTNNAMQTNSLLLLRSRACTNVDQCLIARLSNGIGRVSLHHRSLDGQPVTFQIQVSTASNVWPESSTVITITNSSMNWLSSSNYTTCYLTGYPPSGGPYYVRILHTTTNASAGLLLDSVQLLDSVSFDQFTWQGNNALITGLQVNRLRQIDGNIKGAYLNNSETNDTVAGSTPFTNGSYVQSCYLTNGIGEISFWYRNWGTNTPTPIPAASSFRITAAPSNNALSPEWITLCTVSNITNLAFRYFTTNYYDVDNHYLRIYCITNTTSGRLCLDDLLIAAPFGADLKLKNLAITPPIPLDTNSVDVSVDLYDFFLSPFITNVTAYYYVGTNPWATWTNGVAIPMMLMSNGEARGYNTTLVGHIPAFGVDTVVQYCVRCDFAGLFSDKTSPKFYRGFVNPSWYYPTDLNAGQTVTNPYYIVFSCPPQTVWINEIYGYACTFGAPEELDDEFVELCGPSGTRVQNWRLEVVRGTPTAWESYTITNATLRHDTTNGYGFLVVGDPTVDNVDTVFTNGASGTENIPAESCVGLRLVRSMGAYEQQVSFGVDGGNLTPYGFEYIAIPQPYYSSLALEGSGSNYSAFAWNQYFFWPSNFISPGLANHYQTLEGQATENEPPFSVVVDITGFWTASGSNWIVFAVTGTTCSIEPVPWYSTNLITATWYAITNSIYSFNQQGSTGIYTQRFALQTNNASFYKITTNTP